MMRRTRSTASGDRGATLILVLVLVVICSLVVVPLLSYAVGVTRAGLVQSDKAQAVENARSGLRTAVASTRALYENCGAGVGSPPVALASNGIAGVASTCQVVSTENYRELAATPYQVGVIQVDQTVPPPFNASGLYYPNPNTGADVDAWYSARRPIAQQGTVWTPALPARPTAERTTSSGPPQSYGRAMSYGNCSVYYPGTYTYPVEVRGPTPAFFVSGIYYFESTLTFRNGATAVIGDGEADNACTTDREALTYVPTKPDVTHISGVGATFVFGKAGRMILDNTAGPVSVTFNQRYVSNEELGALPSAGVSIITVDGDTDLNPDVVSELVVDKVIANPPSTVNIGGTVVPVDVVRDGYRASTHTPEPFPPDAPTGLTATAVRTNQCTSNSTSCTYGAATLSWTAPADNGYLITDYVVRDFTSNDVVPCPIPDPVAPETALQPSCTVTGLNHNVGRRFYVQAVNAGGVSPNSNTSSTVTPDAWPSSMSPLVTAPGNMTYTGGSANVPDPTTRTNGAVATWTAPSTGNSPITRYTVTATPTINPAGNPVVTCTSWWNAAQCLLPRDNASTPQVDGLVASPATGAPVERYTVAVTATNAFGSSVPGAGRSWVYRPTTGSGTYTPPAPRPPDSVRVPDPVIDVRATNSTTNRITLQIPGYIAIAQGRLAIDGGDAASKNIHDIDLVGGILAAQISLSDVPSSAKLELSNPVIQKTIRLVTTASGRRPATSVAIVQINDNFGWKLNSWVVQ